ncbi:hypothetical protein AA0119_g13131 [Alternaria tenuissima]|uniref:Carrier domain-containing protein n=1 Tax=Alternaria tenuissima TaxID=119927 RepID=A0ABY0FRY8_9PLEO|nr:hypothetical protein AA0119_g13131 [Alternaria tenuissima]
MVPTAPPPLAVPDHIDRAAEEEPNAIWAWVPRSSSSVDQGWRDITFAQLAQAVDSLAWSLEETLGVSDPIGQTIGYIGPNDLQYLVVLAAALKVGYVPLLVSPRNSPEGQQSILKETECTLFLSTPDRHRCFEDIQKVAPNTQIVEVPLLLDLLDPSHRPPHYDGRHRRDGAANSLILHTSGSTGLPKAVRLTVGGLNSVYEQANLGREQGRQSTMKLFLADQRLMLAAVPFFHAMGIVVGLRSLMCRSSIATLPSGKLWNASLVIGAIAAINPATGVFPPSILEDMSGTEAGFHALGRLDTVFFGGAPLANASGEKLCRVTKLQTIIGSTEALLIPSLDTTAPDEWGYFHWSDAAGAVMEPAENELYELVLERRDTSCQAVFQTLPGEEKWLTKDLFRQHPTKPFLWKYSGRRDDTIVLSNGEKVNPVSMEKCIESHACVKGALVVGQGRFQTGLLIEPERDGAGMIDSATLVEHIWPTVEQANREAPAHARIYQNKIAVTEREKSFERTPKGSIIRLPTVAMFHDEIAALYNDEKFARGSSLESGAHVELRSTIRAVFIDVLASFHEGTLDDVDICSLEVDSLGVLALAEALQTKLQRRDITAATIYQNPTVHELTLALSPGTSRSGATVTLSTTREEQLGAMVRKYTIDMVQQKRVGAERERPSKHTVILTGSTGSLGSQVLKTLVQRPEIEQVYCLDRSDDAETRQRHAFVKYYGMEAGLHKVEFLQADFGLAGFGLEKAVYERLLSSVTIFIHSAWSVNFNLSLSSYEATHIAGTRHVVDFASESVHKSSITFVSSIASVGNWGSVVQDDSAVPESTTTLFDRSIPLLQGYGESKHVAAEILAIASHRLGIQTAIVRASQLAGPSAQASGVAWNRHEWLPSLVHASRVMKKLPRTLGTMEQVDWVPMDVAGATMVDIATASTSQLTRVYHLANPHRTSWRQLYPVIQEFYKSNDVAIGAIEYSDWVHELGQIPLTKENAERVPGLKLLDFYRGLCPETATGLPRLATKKAEAVSPTLREGRAVGGCEVRKWLEQWAL